MQKASPETSQDKGTRKKGRVDVTGLIDIVIALAVIVGAWQAFFWLDSRYLWLGPYSKVLFPSPMRTLDTFERLVRTGMLPTAVYTTGYRLVAGFALVMLLGVTVGIGMVRFRRFGKTMASFALGMQSFPSIAWVPFAMLIVGLSDYGVLFVIVMSSAFSVMHSTYSGLRNIPPIYMKAARSMGARRLSLLRGVMIPAATPSLITGMRQAWSFSWHAVIGAEVVMISLGGLGGILYFGEAFNAMDQVLACMITIFVIGFAVDRLIFFRLERRVRSKWGLAS
ncbi:MAG: ABC transporter permease [Nitrososphaerales archaeon]